MNDVDRVNERDATIAALQARVQELERDRYKQGFIDALEKVASDWASKEFRGHDEIQSCEVQAFLDTRHVHYEECRGVKPLQSQLTQRTAELERVRLLSSHNERRFELLEEKYKELRTLILTLPKVEGEIVAQAGYVKDRKKVYACFGSDADMTAYAALLTHRQGMEGV